MDTERIPGRAIAIAVVVFLFLAGVHLWWQQDDTVGRGGDNEMVIEETQLDGGEERLHLGAADRPDPGARREEAQKWLEILASDAPLEKRRSAALHLQYLAGPEMQKALLQHLKSEDPVIARRCAETLVDFWQQSESPSVNRLMKQGVAAFEEAEYQRAMKRFQMCLQLNPQVSDLHRLRAEILLSRGEVDKALQAAQQATTIQRKNYWAHYVVAQCYLRQNEGDKALDEVEWVLDIYPTFKPARNLKNKIRSLQKAGEL